MIPGETDETGASKVQDSFSSVEVG